MTQTQEQLTFGFLPTTDSRSGERSGEATAGAREDSAQRHRSAVTHRAQANPSDKVIADPCASGPPGHALRKLLIRGERVLRLPEVRRMTGLSRSSIYELQADGRFPRSIKLGERAVGWLEQEVREWLARRIEASRTTVARACASASAQSAD